MEDVAILGLIEFRYGYNSGNTFVTLNKGKAEGYGRTICEYR